MQVKPRCGGDEIRAPVRGVESRLASACFFVTAALGDDEK